MGQTLTHGVYLPDEGERNCYNGLAANWQLLDGAVGTVAEHTTALAGKASAVHTHTKSDVTDLFNSANTWSESQTYHKTVISNAAEVLHCKNANVALGETPASDYQKLFMFKDKNNDNFGYYRHLYQTTGSSQFDILVRNKFTNGAPDISGSVDYLSFSLRLNADKSKEGVLMGSFKPSNTNTYDLGSSSYQWNNLYAKGYYYNGTAWGLDKANTWSKTQGFVGENQGTEFSGNYYTCFAMYGKFDTVGKSGMFFTKYRPYKAQGSLVSSDIIQYGVDVLENEIRTNNVFDLQVSDYDSNTKKFTKIDVISALSNANLGNSTNKWKTLNGVNPGALSLPSGAAENINTDNWNFSWSANTVTAPFDGYISIACFGSALQINNETKSYAMTYAPGSDGFICGLLPVSSGDSIKVLVTRTQTSIYEGYKFIKASGNVS